MNETITRKVARLYHAELFKGVTANSEGDAIGATPINIENASEVLVLNLAEKVVKVAPDNSETFIEPTRAWLDNLPEADFKIIETAAIKIKNGADEKAKK